MAEPPQKKKKQSQWDMCNITLDKIKVDQQLEIGENSQKLKSCMYWSLEL